MAPSGASLTAALAASTFLVLLLAVWVLYPVCVVALSKLLRSARRAVPSPAAGEWVPSVTCVLATREAADAVRARVQDLLNGDYDPSRLTVVVGLDRNSRCTAADLADLAPRVTVVRAAEAGKPSALNRAAAAATGDILIFADTYQRFDPNAISQLVAVLRDRDIGAVSGNLERGEKWRWQPVSVYWRLERWLRLNESVIHSCVGVTGAIYAMRAEQWRDIPSEVLCDDLYIPMRLVIEGKRVVFEAGAVARDARDVPAGDEFHRKVRTLTGNFQLCLSMPQVLAPLQNPIWVQFLCHKLLRLLSPYLLVGVMLSVFALAISVLSPAGGIAFALCLSSLVMWMASPHSPHAGLRSILLMFAATLVAGWKAVSGDWAVWQESSTVASVRVRAVRGSRQDIHAVVTSEE